MLCARQNGVHGLGRNVTVRLTCGQRNASFASAISRGIRRGHESTDRLGSTPNTSNRSRTTRTVEASFPTARSSPPTPRSRFELDRRAQAGSKTASRLRQERRTRGTRPEDISEHAPLGKPYTIAGSEFLYGTFAVKAALEAGRRRFHKLYIWKGQRTTEDEYDHSLFLLAKAKRVPVEMVAGSWDKMLLKMSGQRPHNGYVLESSPLPKLPVTALKAVTDTTEGFEVDVAPQSQEDEAMNQTFESSGLIAELPRLGNSNRYPLLLWLDRVTDTGNLGAIMRTAWFMGVDAVVIPEHGTAPFSPITIKASAGAAEHLPVLVVKKEIDFVQASQAAGWKFIAAVAPESSSTRKLSPQQQKNKKEDKNLFDERAILDQAPCVLMVGNEGEGLRPMMQKAADHPMSIRGARRKNNGVESLNVSVAAALLTSRLISASSTPRDTVTTHVPSKTDDSFL